MSNPSKSSPVSYDTVRDVFLWRRKKLSLLVLLVSTASWVLLDVYQFNLITVASWAAMFAVTSLFLYGNIARFLRKKEPDLSGLEISEQTAIEAARSVRQSIEEGVRWMCHVSAERELFLFARVVAALWFLSYVGSFWDSLSLLYIDIVVGMTVPVIYLKNEDKIKRFEEWMRMQARRLCDLVDEKVVRRMKNRVAKVKENKVD
ncbi:PREDICTED: reticulon-like protein B13 [Populus euphratica]|uniref:Reticulon-like protein n=1 Tax=Populus euphratica TaxID=75702 RepID=A0AAJ6V1F4_POPEU|nr:PREDICTED: reticulon-like protein B13 [Populus euphratica]